MPRKRSESELLALVGQMSLFNSKIYEHPFAARAHYRIEGKWTRNAVKILLADIQDGDTDFRQCFIPREVLWGGINKRNGQKNETLEEETKKMAGDTMLVRDIDTTKRSFTVYNFFDGKIKYDDEKKGIWARLNPYLAPYYLNLKQMSVLQRNVFLALSEPFYKDLYEYIIGCQNAKDINAFFRSTEWICEQFGLSKNYLKNRCDLVDKVERAINAIYKTMEIFKDNTQFSITPRFAETGKDAKNKGKLLGFDFYIETAHGFTRLSDIPEYKRKKTKTQGGKKNEK